MKPNWNLGHTPRPGKHPAWIYRVPRDYHCFAFSAEVGSHYRFTVLHASPKLDTHDPIQSPNLTCDTGIILNFTYKQAPAAEKWFVSMQNKQGAPAGADTSWLQAMRFALYSMEVALSRVYSFWLFGELVKTNGTLLTIPVFHGLCKLCQTVILKRHGRIHIMMCVSL